MDSNKFDDITRALATGVSRRKMLKGLLAGAAGVVGLSRVVPAAAQITQACGAGGKENRLLGDSCNNKNCCSASAHQVCEKVSATGAYRCECDLNSGFISCGGQCVSTSCANGGTLNTTTCTCESSCPATAPESCNGQCFAACPTGTTRDATSCSCLCDAGTVACGGSCVTPCSGNQVRDASCNCVCPSGTEACPADSTTCVIPCAAGLVRSANNCSCVCGPGTQLCNGNCVSTTCPSPLTFNSSTCGCSCPSGQVFCGGNCVDPATVCAGLHNKIFNVDCCNQGANPCQNPGQPSGKCKA